MPMRFASVRVPSGSLTARRLLVRTPALPINAAARGLLARHCSSISTAESYDIVHRAAELKVRLSPPEIANVMEECDKMGNNDGIFTREEFIALVRKERLDEAERLALTDFITKKDENSFGQRALLAVDYLATALFGAVGVIVAGQAGMNVVGATLVGCVACLGGGTLNNVMTNNLRGGVFWMRSPVFLYIGVAVSILTFYAWPLFEEHQAQLQMNALRRRPTRSQAQESPMSSLKRP